MKIFAVIVTLFLIVGCVHLSNNSSTVDIDGTWRGEIELGTLTGIGKPGEPLRSTPPRKVTTYVFFNFKREGDSVKGTISLKHLQGKYIPLDDIEIKGMKISFTGPSMIGLKMMAPTENMEQTEIKTRYMGNIKGEKIELSIITEMPILPMPGSLYSRETEVRNRTNHIAGRHHSIQDNMGGDTTSGVQSDLSLAYGASIPDKDYLADEITIERISKIPENPVN